MESLLMRIVLSAADVNIKSHCIEQMPGGLQLFSCEQEYPFTAVCEL